jgi:hypothetical protein
MSELVPVAEPLAPRVPATVALGADAPTLRELFAFAEEAELRFESLRMAILERVVNARGEETTRHEVLVRHPGLARVTRRRTDDPLSRQYDVWVGDGETVTTFDAWKRLASVRRRMPGVVGAVRADLPEHGRIRPALTPLPAPSLAESFVHPRGLLRNVVASGPHRILGTAIIAGRETFILEVDHPRSSLVLADRPDRSITVGLDRMTGLVLLLVEAIGEAITRHAEVTALELDGAIPDEAFRLHLGPDVRLIY